MNNNCRNEVKGNGVLLVIIDSSANYWDHLIVDETVFSALNHFGFPYRIVDLGNKRLDADELNNCAGIILAQSRIGDSLTDSESQLISETVQQGIGLVNFDNDLRLMKPALLEVSEEKLKANFKYDDEFWEQIGATPGTTNRMHWGEYGVHGLPYLKERNRMFFCPARQPGVMKADQDMGDGFQPYNLQTCYYDILPQNPDFFVFASSPERHSEDFLTGCTVNLRECESNDTEKAAKIGAKRITKSLRDGFYAELITHEQKVGCLKLEEWDAIFSRIDGLTKHLEILYADHDEIGFYLKGKLGTHLTDSVVEDNTIHCQVAGETTVPLRISVFTEIDEAIIREYTTIQPFEGKTDV